MPSRSTPASKQGKAPAPKKKPAAKKPAAKKPVARKAPPPKPAPPAHRRDYARTDDEEVVPAASAGRGTPGSVVDAVPKVTAYAWGGQEVDPTVPEAIVKVVVTPDGNTRHFIKQATSGPDRGHLFNPQSPTYDPSFLKRVSAQLGKGRYEFRRASKVSFELYMRYILPPYNPVNYRGAQRNL